MFLFFLGNMEWSVAGAAARVVAPIVWTVADLILNGLILVSVVRHKTLRKKAYFLMISLSILDLLKVTVYILYVANGFLKHSQIKINLCLASSSLGIALLCCTTLHLMMESLNRLVLIYRPFRHNEMLTKKVMTFILTVVWLLPIVFVLGIPFAFFPAARVFKISTKVFSCQGLNTSNPAYAQRNSDTFREKSIIYNLTIQIIFFIIPCLTMLICYIHIFRFATKTASQLKKLQIPSEIPDTRNANFEQSSTDFTDIISSKETEKVEEISLEECKYQQQSAFTIHSIATTLNQTKSDLKRKLKAQQKEIKAAKTVLVIFLAFVFCNAPLFVTVWWSVKRRSELFDIKTRLVLLNLALGQVIINPLVYFFRLDDFKKARRKIRTYGTIIARKISS